MRELIFNFGIVNVSEEAERLGFTEELRYALYFERWLRLKAG